MNCCVTAQFVRKSDPVIAVAQHFLASASLPSRSDEVQQGLRQEPTQKPGAARLVKDLNQRPIDDGFSLIDDQVDALRLPRLWL